MPDRAQNRTRPVPVAAPVVVLALLFSLLASLASARAIDPLAALLTAPRTEVAGITLDQARLARFYRALDGAPQWVGPDGPLPRLARLVAVLEGAAREGLRPADYHAGRLAAALRAGDGHAEVELLASHAFLLYVEHLRNGRVDPAALDDETHPPGEMQDSLPLALRTLAAPDLARALAAAAPANPDYRRLRRALAAYRAIEAAGGWPVLPEGPTLRRGDRGPRVAILRARLMAERDLTIATAEPELFDAALDLAVRAFQRRHGLEADGLVGRMTRAAMNVSVADRIRQIELNMERWRWMPDDLGRRYVLVNLAGFELEVVEEGSLVMAMRVIVGRTYRKSPVFSGRMTYLELNPFWNIPPRIAREDILPRVRRDPSYLREQGIRVLADWSPGAPEIDPRTIDWARVDPRRMPYKFRQDPGPMNALGRIKFMFPNRFAVYLHDTPARELFDRTVRTFSSGCIRIERPLELATWLLRGTALASRAALEEAIATGRTQAVTLPEPVAVHLTYATVWVGEDGRVQFRDDVYGRDAGLALALALPGAGHGGG